MHNSNLITLPNIASEWLWLYHLVLVLMPGRKIGNETLARHSSCVSHLVVSFVGYAVVMSACWVQDTEWGLGPVLACINQLLQSGTSRFCIAGQPGNPVAGR